MEEKISFLLTPLKNGSTQVYSKSFKYYMKSEAKKKLLRETENYIHELQVADEDIEERNFLRKIKVTLFIHTALMDEQRTDIGRE